MIDIIVDTRRAQSSTIWNLASFLGKSNSGRLCFPFASYPPSYPAFQSDDPVADVMQNPGQQGREGEERERGTEREGSAISTVGISLTRSRAAERKEGK